jgi:hypothetical protein
MEKYEQAKKLIQDAKNIHILPVQSLRADSFSASVALFYALKKLNKSVNLVLDKTPDDLHFLSQTTQKISLLKDDFIISINEKKTKVSQVSYEKTENELKIYLKTSDGKTIKREDVYFENNDIKQDKLFPYTDLLITLGVKDFSEVENNFQNNFSNILNIDNQVENTEFGKVNLKEMPSTMLSDIIVKLLRTIRQEEHEENNYLESPQSSLFQKILKKIKIKGEKNIACVILKDKDFEETDSQPSDLSFSLSKLKNELPHIKDFLVLWQEKDSPIITKCVFYSPDNALGEKILERFEGKQKGNGVLFFVREEDMPEARDKILKIIES